MKKKDQLLLAEVASAVRAMDPRARVFAFGSRVNGHAKQDSDLDVCVVLDHSNTAIRARLWDCAWEIGFRHDVLISLIPYTAAEFDIGPCSQSPLVLAVKAAGVPA